MRGATESAVEPSRFCRLRLVYRYVEDLAAEYSEEASVRQYRGCR